MEAYKLQQLFTKSKKNIVYKWYKIVYNTRFPVTYNILYNIVLSILNQKGV